MKRSLLAMAVLACAFLLSACGDDGDAGQAQGPRVALLLARGGLGDRAFNDSANAGLQRAAAELGAQVTTVGFREGAQVDVVRETATRGYDLVIGLGSENAQPIATVAPEHPERRFAIVDASVDAPNVTSVTFKELEGDYLVGVLSALMSPGGKVGFLGGADVDVVRRIGDGWRQGVLSVNPQAQLMIDYVGGKDDFSGFTKPDVAKEKAARLYAAGAEIVYTAAGGSQTGAIDAAKAARRPIITAGTDQRYLGPEVVVTSRLKDMASAVFGLIQDLARGSLAAGSRVLDYRSGGIALAPYDGGLVPAAALERFRAVVADVEAGKRP